MSGRIVLISKLKGGAGATTATREIATYAASNKVRSAVIDLDGQGTLTRWWQRRPEEKKFPTLLQIDIAELPAKADAIREKYGLTIIDTPPSTNDAIRSLASIADLVVIPTRATPDDLDTIGPVIRQFQGIIPISFVLTATAGKRSVDATQAETLLKPLGAILGRTTNRAAYYRAAAAGETGNETDDTAKAEIAAIFRSMMKAFPKKPDNV